MFYFCAFSPKIHVFVCIFTLKTHVSAHWTKPHLILLTGDAEDRCFRMRTEREKGRKALVGHTGDFDHTVLNKCVCVCVRPWGIQKPRRAGGNILPVLNKTLRPNEWANPLTTSQPKAEMGGTHPLPRFLIFSRLFQIFERKYFSLLYRFCLCFIDVECYQKSREIKYAKKTTTIGQDTIQQNQMQHY